MWQNQKNYGASSTHSILKSLAENVGRVEFAFLLDLQASQASARTHQVRNPLHKEACLMKQGLSWK
jgi:hypothetical protein